MIKSKFKRRLRKKFHLGEFQVFGVEIFLKFEPTLTDSDFAEFSDDFINLIEANKLLFDGGGQSKSWEGFVSSARKVVSPTEDEREMIKNWLENHPEVVEVRVGEFLDAWNDPKWND
ncbi:MAG: YggL family protein [Acidobacteria bacterium]|nr:YggL family protein [Acidobacteriota bacterium]